MDFNQLHFAYPIWFWLGIIIPFVWMIFYFFYKVLNPSHHLEKFIDRHLLPYLLVQNTDKKSSGWKTVLLWSLVWFCLTVALAGPRWNLREVETFSSDQTLVILLDLSDSMNATDIKPSRLVRAKQKIEDLINHSEGAKIGLIAFAADPHMIVPVTDDKETIRHLLPSLNTDLIYVQGSRLSSALDMASVMLNGEPGNNKALLVISDGGFEDSSAIITAKKLAEKGIVIYAMGVGTPAGITLHESVHTKLEKERLIEISKVGNGRYLDAGYSNDELLILKNLKNNADAQVNLGKKQQFWDEGFYLMIIPIIPVLLWWFRRGYVFAAVLLLFTPAFKIDAANYSDYFMNPEQLAEHSFDQGDYKTAASGFEDPYRKGVAYYKADNFVEAEKMFKQSTRPEVACDAAYNQGNALVFQNKLKEAITAYEEVLKKWPDHTKAKENLEIVKKMLEQQKQENSNSDPQQDKDENQSDEQDKNENQDSKESDEKDQSKDNDSGNEKEQEQPQNEDSSENEQEQEQQQQQPEEKENQPSEMKEQESPQQKKQEAKAAKSEEDQDADLWLSQIDNDPKQFLKNKFYIESKKNGTKEGIDPW